MNIKKVFLSALLVVSFSSQAITCRDLVLQKDELKGLELIQDAIGDAEKGTIPRNITAALVIAQKERDLVLKAHRYQTLREMVIDECASHDQDLKRAVSMK